MQKYIFALILAANCFITTLCAHANMSNPLQVLAVTLSPQPDGTETLRVKLSQPVTHRIFVLPTPPRIVIDLPPFQWRVDATELQKYHGKLVQNIRYARFDSQTSRIVLDLQQPAILVNSKANNNPSLINELSFELQAANPQIEPSSAAVTGLIPQDMTLELAKREATTPPPASEPSQAIYVPQTQPQQTFSPPTAFITEIPKPKTKPVKGFANVKTLEAPKKLPLIVIDAGHGGQDPGTIGNSKTKEKNITLAYAHALKDALIASGHYRAELTRSGDHFILLRERFRMARKQKADLFISLHADSAPTTSAKGLSIYTLSEEASDAEAEALATQENKVDILAEVNLGTQDEEVAGILIDLAQRETTNKSIILAESIVAGLRGRIELLPNTHRYAGFAVLKAPDIPSALIEIGFLSNPEEERKILTRSHRQQVIQGLITGISKYFVHNHN